MAGIFANIDSDIGKIRQLRSEIEKVKKALTSINVKVDIDIAKGMEAQLKSLTAQYDALVQKVAQAEAKIAESTARINKSAETIVRAQEQMTKAASGQGTASVQGAPGGNAAATNAQTASVEAQAKAYDELAAEIDAVMGTRAQNIKRMTEEQNAIRIVNEELKRMQKLNQSGSYSASETKRMEQLNASLLMHKTALAELRQNLNNAFKLDGAAATSMNALSQSLARMRMTYRELTEEERNSPFGQELLASIQQADARIKQLDASIGNHQRNVGNYASGWNGLNMSIQQIGRELPSLAMGWNTFFLAISNNLPILTDEIKRAKDEYNNLKKAGQQATPVWKQVVSSLLSWQTALTVGITLLTMYGKDIIEWTGNLFKAKDGTKELEEAMKRLDTAVSTVYGNASEEMRVLRDLNDSLENAKRGTEEWDKIRNRLVTGYSKYLPSIDREIEKTGTLAGSYDRLAESIQRAAAARGFEQYSSEENKKYIEERNKRLEEVYDAMTGQLGEDEGNKLYKEWLKWLDSGQNPSRELQGKFGDIGVGWGLGNANSVLFELRNLQKARDESIEKFRNMFGITEGAEDDVAADSIKALRDRIAAQREALEKLSVSSKEYKDLFERIQQDEQKLQKLTMTPDKQGKQYNSIKEQQDKIDELLDKQSQARVRQQVDLENQVEQARIDAMADGAEKVRAQRNLDNKKELEAIERQKEEYKQKVVQAQKEIFEAQEELKAKQNPSYKKKSFDASSVSVDTSAFDAIYSYTQTRQANDKLREQERAWNEYLIRYGTFQQKREAISKEYQQKIAEAGGSDTWQGKLLRKQMEEALKELDFSQFKDSINFADIFGNLDAQTTGALKSLRDKLKEYINNAAKDLRPEDLKELQDAFDDLDFKIAERDPFGEFGKSLDEYKNAQDAVTKAQQELNTVMQGGTVVTGIYTDETGKLVAETLSQAQAEEILNDAQKKRAETLADLTTAINSIGSKGMAIVNTGNEIAGMLDNFGIEIPEVVSSTLSGLGQVMSGLESIDITKPFSLITGTVSVISGIGNTIAGWFSGDKNNEKQIQRLQDQIDTLTSSYNKLGCAVEEAYSKDASGLIEDQNKLLEQQKLLIEQQIREEQDKKKTDDGRIKQWQQQIEEINQTIEDNKEAAVDAIFGEDLQSAIENFADAYSDAWANGEDRAQSAKDTVKKMMQQMVTESIKAAIQSSGKMEEIRQKLQEFYADNVLTGWEQDYIYRMAENLQEDLDREFGWADSLMKGDSASAEQSATSRDFETMTQDQASELRGRFTAMYESELRQEAVQQGLRNIADETRSLIAQSYLELQQISENTGEIVKPIKQMQLDIAEVRRNTARI